ncbi:hypothetical protein EJD97_021246 [Solanum chilense]|uniref:CCHC-type domain-containing protein n=1 Tax=Solanum chilense TaxID=4083 RepID=A0A6N2CA92_SOLCI|nr:hypothetical protein EJD97_021246 [Solanum chilense]
MDPKVKLEKSSGSQNSKPTCDTCGKKHYGKCLVGTKHFFGCGKDGHKVKDCPIIAAREKEGKQVPPIVPGDNVPKKNRVYALRARGSMPADEDDVGMS